MWQCSFKHGVQRECPVCQKAPKKLQQGEGLQAWGASREVPGQCHVLGQSVPISTMASAVQDVSPMKAKAGGLQPLVQVCVIIGQETSKLQAAFPRFYCKRQPVCAGCTTLLHPQPTTAFLHPTPLHLPWVLWFFQSLLPVVSMTTRLRDFLQHPHFFVKIEVFSLYVNRIAVVAF